MSIAESASRLFPAKHRFTVSQYMRMADSGILASRTELVHGEIVDMAPQGNAHSIAISNLYDELRQVFPKPWFIRVQATHRFSEDLAYEPDLVLLQREPVPGASVDARPELVVEVSETTPAYDIGQKRLDYALHGVAEYWIVDLPRKRVLIFRAPNTLAATADDAYSHSATAEISDELSCALQPDRKIRVSDFMPATVG